MDIDEAGLFIRVNIAAQRARQIMQGAPPKLQSSSRKPAAIAIQELEGGELEAFTPAELPDPPEEGLAEEDLIRMVPCEMVPSVTVRIVA